MQRAMFLFRLPGKMLLLILSLLIIRGHGWISPIVARPTRLQELSSSSYIEPDNDFGRMTYWDETYAKESEFSWYAGWHEELEPFFVELVPSTSAEILIPGIGNDGCIRDMFDDGYTHLSAFDYAPEGVECAKKLFGTARLESIE